jgi:RNA polymerase sigma-70 factor, ECF subfamily
VAAPADDLSATYRRFLAPVRLKCRRLLRDAAEAEEAAHECFVRFMKARPARALQSDAPMVMGWLYRTCTRICIDILRRRRLVAPPPALADGGEEAPAVPAGVDLEDALAARRVIEALSAQAGRAELEAAVLCRVDGLRHPEAAAVLGVSERTLRRLLQRFDDRTQQLRKELA